MKVVILAGGLGTRLAEETGTMPKPMVEIGGHPILWHIMKVYSHWGFNDFVVLTGYKSHVIKDYFLNYYNRYSDLTVDMENNSVELHSSRTEPWRVTMLYTELNTMTGGRLLRAQNFLRDEPFMLTYGDGLANVDIKKLLACHRKAKKIATLTAVKPFGRFGLLEIEKGGLVSSFKEKAEAATSKINGGFFVLEPEIFAHIKNGDNTIFESHVLEPLAAEGNLNSYQHKGFWRAMDTIHDKNYLTNLWFSNQAPWKLWS